MDILPLLERQTEWGVSMGFCGIKMARFFQAKQKKDFCDQNQWLADAKGISGMKLYMEIGYYIYNMYIFT